MRRYLFEKDINLLPRKDFDVIIAGAGISGLFAALQLPGNISCAVLVKGELRSCNTYLAQGGVAAEFDDTENHFCDTVRAGSGAADEAMARLMVEDGHEVISDLIDLGVSFDKDKEGELTKTLEGGHSKKRILHCGGDATGKVILDQLIYAVSKKPNIKVFENHFLVDITTNEQQQVNGTLIYHKSMMLFVAPEVIICTGGAGQLFQNTTNFEGTTGDGIAAALRAGCDLRHMQFVQFHPTVFFDVKNGKSRFLISEALRGEGGILLNSHKVAFMQGRHPMKDLAPRDVVAREIYKEIKNSRQAYVYLNITSRGEAFLKKRFPNIFRLSLKNGVNIGRDLIPVVPAQHYIMGGISINENGAASIEGLYACGEAACSGVHGANRLASNSLLDCLVFAKRCALNLKTNGRAIGNVPSDTSRVATPFVGETSEIVKSLQETIEDYCGIVRTQKGLKIAYERITSILEILDNASLHNPAHFEVYNMALVAHEITKAAIQQKFNIGCHYSED